MALKQRVLQVLEYGDAVRSAFVAGLSDEQRSAAGTFEKWSAKDAVAHMAYWIDHRAAVEGARGRGEEAPPSAHYEQANAACYQRFRTCSWDEVLAFAASAQAKLVEAVRALPEEMLLPLSTDSGAQVPWQAIVGTAYSHPLMHMAEFYVAQGQPQQAGELWSDWGELVAPLDDKPDWQGLVHYNVACGLSLAAHADQALAELRRALQLRPNLITWSRQDSDLAAARGLPDYRKLYAPEYWWTAMEANPLAEACADQFVRTLAMFREAVKAFPSAEWRKGDTPYQRPAGLALHLVEAVDDYSALKAGESGKGRPFSVDWEAKDSARLPSQDELLAYLDQAEQRLAQALARADLTASEELFRGAGSTLLSRMAYALRHTQHHLAEMCLELHRRGYRAPQWQ